MRVLSKGKFSFLDSEFALLRGILRSAEGNIVTRDDKEKDDHRQLAIIKRMLENL